MEVKLREESGEVALHMSLILIVGALLLGAALQVHHVYTVIDTVTAKTDEAVLAVAADNVAEVFDGVWESDWVARQCDGEKWMKSVSTLAVETALKSSLGAVPDGAGLLVAGGYRITGLQTTAHNLQSGNLNFTTRLTLEIPLHLGSSLLPPIHKTLEVKSTYEPRF